MPRFRAELKVEGKTATYFEVPLDVPAVFGQARPPVRGTINGSPHRSTIAKYGDTYFVSVNRKVREGAGVAAGDPWGLTPGSAIPQELPHHQAHPPPGV